MRSVPAAVARRLRVVRWPVIGVVGCVLWAVASALPAGGATVPALPASGVSTADGSWSTLPMGQLSDQSNTFWQLFHAAPGSSRWTLVTPEGTADNGGLVAGVSGDSIAAGVLPSALLRFSPLSSSSDGGASWSPVFLPGALARSADALAIETSGTPAGLAVLRDGTVLAAAKSLGSWAPLVSTAVLRRAAPSCAVSAIAAVAFSAAGAPLVATGCGRGGRVGLFSQTDGSWHVAGPALTVGRGRGATGVVRLETSGVADDAARHRGRRQGIGRSKSRGRRTIPSGPCRTRFPCRARTRSAPAPSGRMDGSRSSSAGRNPSGPSSKWDQAAGPGPPCRRRPPGRRDSPSPARRPTVDAPPVDVFSVNGSALRVFELTPSGATWSRVQTTQVPISYGSSS